MVVAAVAMGQHDAPGHPVWKRFWHVDGELIIVINVLFCYVCYKREHDHFWSRWLNRWIRPGKE